VESAKTDGRWDDAYASPSKIEVPEALRAAFEDNPLAGEAFAALNASSRSSILYRIQHIKDPEARLRRVEQVVEMLTRGEGI
jgi:uncharacterized protein YdeI (YjbR/CyaY-like superfamily)